jgi:hypothetical protein
MLVDIDMIIEAGPADFPFRKDISFDGQRAQRRVPLPTAKGVLLRVPSPFARHGHGLQEKICSSSCLS